MIWLGYGLAWLSTSIATSVGIYYTHSAWCLWALILPACINISSNKDKDTSDNMENNKWQ